MNEKRNQNANVSITVLETLDIETAEKIAYFQWKKREFAARVMRWFEQNNQESDCFNVIAINDQNDVVGRIFCLQNITDKSLWYFGDMFVAPEYRRLHIAENMLVAAIKLLKEKGGQTLRSYVEPNNVASLNFHNKLGFSEKEIQPFNYLINDGRIMFEKKIV